MRHARLGAALLTAAAALALPALTRAQGVTERPPLLSGAWVGVPGIVYFNFIHRFTESGAPEHKITNTPTFVLAAALPWNALAGVNYATNSALVSRYPNEHEYFLRTAPISHVRGAPVDLGFEAGYNDAARGAGGEASLSGDLGPLRLLSAVRVLKGLDTASTRLAVGGGVVLRLNRYVALAGDAVGLTKRAPGERIAWSAGLQLAIPLTPHTLSLQASNVSSNTLQGSSRGLSTVRYGFEFTIPITLRRYFGHHEPEGTTTTASASAPATANMTVVHIRGMSFHDARIEVPAGTTVEWHNDDPLGHTVTANDGSFASPIIEPGQSWRYRFDRPGEYAFHCTPHPFMTGVVVVR